MEIGKFYEADNGAIVLCTSYIDSYIFAGVCMFINEIDPEEYVGEYSRCWKQSSFKEVEVDILTIEKPSKIRNNNKKI